MKASRAGELITEITLAVFKVQGLLNSDGDRLTKELGLTSSRWKILGALGRLNSSLTVPQIGRSMGQSRQAVQRLVDVMIKDGFLQLVDNPNHKRARYIKMTSLGEETYEHLYKKQIPWAESCSVNITIEELETALLVIEKLSKNIGGVN